MATVNENSITSQTDVKSQSTHWEGNGRKVDSKSQRLTEEGCYLMIRFKLTV